MIREPVPARLGLNHQNDRIVPFGLLQGRIACGELVPEIQTVSLKKAGCRFVNLLSDRVCARMKKRRESVPG